MSSVSHIRGHISFFPLCDGSFEVSGTEKYDRQKGVVFFLFYHMHRYAIYNPMTHSVPDKKHVHTVHKKYKNINNKNSDDGDDDDDDHDHDS